MEQDCSKCSRKDTKYRCIDCNIPICNVCSVACSTETPGYSEERYCIGKCNKCQSLSNISETKPTLPDSSNVIRVKQSRDLTSYFRKVESTARSTEKASTKLCTSGKDKGKSVGLDISFTSTSHSTEKARALSVTTANRWKSTSLAKYQASEWLEINTGKAGTDVQSLNCSVCRAYAENLKGMKNFSTVWAFTGSTNLRHSNAEDHARGEPHKKAMNLHLKDQGQNVFQRAESMKTTNEADQGLVTTGITNMQDSDRARTKTKFEVAYFVAKSEISLMKYPEILKLEEKHGVDIGNAYRNNMSCSSFINYIGQDLGKNLQEKLSLAKFYSVLADGSEDVSITEKEAVFVQYLDKNPPKRDTVQVVNSFLCLSDLEGSTAADIASSIRNGFENIGISEDSLNKKLVGFAADGASVNRGNREGVISILQRDLPWIIYVWCVAHRLELSLKDALKGTCFDDVDEMLLRLYYLYENSPKKLRQLRDLHQIYSESFEFEEGGVRPKRASGTRWITHKVNALQIVVDKYGIFIQHLQNMSEDNTFKPSDRQKFKGWLKRWQSARIPLLSCLFIEILSPAKVLSLAFQEEEIDTVSSISRIEQAKKQLQRLKKTEFEDLPMVKRFLEKVEEADDTFTYQNVSLHSFQAHKDYVKKAKNDLLDSITQALEARLEVAESTHVSNAATVINTEGWERKNSDGEEDVLFADRSLTELYNHFKVPLSHAGLVCSLHDLLEEWHSLVSYTTRYLNPSQIPYLRVWRRIFDSAQRDKWSNVLILVELLFCIPISNAKVERLFSLMKRIKSDSRASLSEGTLNSLVRICIEGPEFEDYNPASAMQLWYSSHVRRPQQSKRKKYHTKQASKKPKVLIDEADTSDGSSEESDPEEGSSHHIV